MTQNRFIDESIITEAIESKDRLLCSTFPIHIFPEKIKDIIRSTNECLNFPIDYISASVIFGISIGIGNTHVVRIKDSWKESCVLYLSLIGPRGVSKSHPITFCLQPFFNHDSTEVIKYRESCLKYEENTRISKKEREEQSQFTASIQEPKLKKYIVSDITPESLAYIHENNKRGICLYADELASWFKNFNRYSKGSEEQFWLSSFSGKPIILDRRGTKSTISILNSFIGVVGTMQYGILRDLSRGDRSQNGFMDRILFAMPSQIEKQYWNKLQLPKHIIPLWDSMISLLINLDYALDANGEIVPIELSYSLEAEAILTHFAANHP